MLRPWREAPAPVELRRHPGWLTTAAPLRVRAPASVQPQPQPQAQVRVLASTPRRNSHRSDCLQHSQCGNSDREHSVHRRATSHPGQAPHAARPDGHNSRRTWQKPPPGRRNRGMSPRPACRGWARHEARCRRIRRTARQADCCGRTSDSSLHATGAGIGRSPCHYAIRLLVLHHCAPPCPDAIHCAPRRGAAQ